MKGKATLAGRETRKRKSKPKKLDVKKDFNEPVKRPPRQSRLPGMEDSAIKDLEEAAIEHSETKSEIAAKRADLKGIDVKIATLMKANGKKSYSRGGIKLKLREGRDSVSVQVKRHEHGSDESEATGESE